MNPLLIQTYTSANTVTNTSQHHQPRFDYNAGVQLLDSVTKSFLDINEWVAQELQRIEENQIPRNCYSYEALITVIEGVNQVGYYSVICARHRETPSTLHESPQCCMNHDDSNNLKPPLPKSAAILLESKNTKQCTDQQDVASHHNEEMQKNTQNKDETCLTNDTLAKLATINSHHLTQKSLIMAFMKLAYYCFNKQRSIYFYLQRYRKPLELLIELENMCDTYFSWTSLVDINTNNALIINDITKIQKRLQCILFGDQIPLIDNLVCPWTLISLWARHGNQLVNYNDESNSTNGTFCNKLSQQQQQQQYSICIKWIEFGVCSYQIAKKACGIGKTTY